MLKADVKETPILYSKISACRSCGNARLLPILDLGEMALTGRFPAVGEVDPPSVPLELVICDVASNPDACGLVQIAHTCELNQMYGPTYGYQSSITKTMVAHLRDTAARTIDLAGAIPGDWVLEVGSNDGTTQNCLANRGLNLVAIDPSAAKFAEKYPAESMLIVDFFSLEKVQAANGGRAFKAIISIAMFYDLERPLDFMRDVRCLLEKDGIWCTEQSYLPATLTSLSYDSICHEHLCYYSLAQFGWMAKRAGLRIVDVVVNDINGGSFTVFACRDDSTRASNVSAIDRALMSEQALHLTDIGSWRTFSKRVRQHRARVRSFFEDARAMGRLVLGLGASTKGNVVLQYAGIDSNLMPAIGERDPRKVGLRTPKSRIPIISEDEARRLNPTYFFVGPWHFREEISSREEPFLAGGGRLVFALPRFEIIGSANIAAHRDGRGISWAKPKIFGDERSFINEALDSTMISGGHFVDEFERQFANLHASPEPAISAVNGTAALQLAYLALGIGPGDEIIVPGWGFMAAANMALAIGATPVFADIEEDTWTIDPADVVAKISRKTKAIVAIHTYGNLCDLGELAKVSRAAGVALIEDCAESLGSKWLGQISGTVGDIATFSFQATKTITCGEGGALLCRSPEVATRARLLRSHAMSGRKRYWHYAVGHNFRLTNLQCAMLCSQLEHWPEIVSSHGHLYASYQKRLNDVPGVVFQSFRAEVEPVVWAVGLRLAGVNEALRDNLIDKLGVEGIECRPGFYAPSAQSIYQAGRLKRADAAANQIIVPPIDPSLSEQSFDRICDTLTRSLKSLGIG